MSFIYKSMCIVVANAVFGAPQQTPPDNRGTEFILMFMENLRLGAQVFDLELYCTTQEKTPVTVHVTTPLWSTPRVDKTFTVVDGSVTKVIIDSSLRMVGSSISDKGISVTANAEIACYGANKETLSNDGYLGLPVDALGTDYFAVVHSPPSEKSEIGIAATEDGTTVTLTLPANNGAVDVTFQGKTYHAGETITATLNKFQTLQIQSTGDLTGIHKRHCFWNARIKYFYR